MSSSDSNLNTDNSLKANMSNQEDMSLGKAFRSYSFYWFLSAINLAIPLIYVPICYILWDEYIFWLALGVGLVFLNFTIFIIAVFSRKDNKEQETTFSTTDSMPIASDNLQQAIPDAKKISAEDFARGLSFFAAAMTAFLSLCALPAVYCIFEIEDNPKDNITILVILVIIMAFVLIMAFYQVFTAFRKYRESSTRK